eukprot:366128-Lingulodinium_polyedra.AAC.1
MWTGMAGCGKDMSWAFYLRRLSTHARKLVKLYRCKDPVHQHLTGAIRIASHKVGFEAISSTQAESLAWG